MELFFLFACIVGNGDRNTATLSKDPALAGWWEQAQPCPEGASVQGAPPPDGARIWCEISEQGFATPHGRETGFWADGSRRYERLWQRGAYEGEYRAWFPSGRIEVEGHFQAGQQVGIWRWWYASGGLKTVDSFQGGVLQGTSIRYYENGTKAFERPYAGGQLDGTAYAWSDQGLLLGTLEFSHGDGHFKEWRADGALMAEGDYQAGKEQGEWRWYTESGELESIEHYERGVMQGEFAYFARGQQLGSFVMDQGTGTWRGWHDNGVLAAEGPMVSELRHGTWIYYDEQGTPFLEQIWEQDQVVSERELAQGTARGHASAVGTGSSGAESASSE